jgi:hypothetical protein
MVRRGKSFFKIMGVCVMGRTAVRALLLYKRVQANDFSLRIHLTMVLHLALKSSHQVMFKKMKMKF